MTLELARPHLLYLLGVLPVWWVLASRGARAGIFLPRGDATARMPSATGWRATGLRILPRLLRSAALASLVFVLAGPERITTVDEVTPRGRGLAVAIDLSSSMLAEDMPGGENRLEIARRAAMRFAEGREHDEMTLVAFAGEAITRVPPTRDRDLVTAGLASLDVHLIRDGSDISAGLLTSLGRLLESETRPRVIVLLSDGAHNGVDVPLPVAARAAETLDVRVHAISIPGPRDGPADPGGGASPATGRGEADRGRALGAVANVTGGRYFRAGSAAALDSIYSEIDAAEAPLEDVTQRRETQSARAPLFLLALLLLGCETLLRGSRWGVLP